MQTLPVEHKKAQKKNYGTSLYISSDTFLLTTH